MEFKDWLREQLNRTGMAQKELALRMDVDESLVSKWLRGTLVPPLGRWEKHLANIFGADEDEIFKIVRYTNEKRKEKLPRWLVLGEPVDEEEYRLHMRYHQLLKEFPIAMMSDLMDVLERIHNEYDFMAVISITSAYLEGAQRRPK